MNRLILRYGRPLTAVILAIFGWVVYRRLSGGWAQILPLAVAAAIIWAVGVPMLIYLWPRLTVNGFRRAVVRRGFGGGPIPVNTLHAEPALASVSAPTGSLLGTGTDDVLYVAGWLDLRSGPQILNVPDTAGRCFGLQFTDPATGTNFATVGKRTTGTDAGEFLLTRAGWAGTVPAGMIQVMAPHRSALVIGRVFVADAADQPLAYALAREIRLTPLVP